MQTTAQGDRVRTSSHLDGREQRRSLRALSRRIPPGCYERSTTRGLSYLARDLALYGIATGILLSSWSVVTIVAGWLLATLAISGLFVLGHDAGHGSLFSSSRLNRISSRIAMLPSLHAASVWVYGHNRVHHAFTGCEGLDFVWHPVRVAEYRAMQRWRRLLHRIEWSRFGAGLYYARAVWWERVVRLPAPPRMKTTFRRDRLLVAGYLAAASFAVLAFGWMQNETLTGAAWVWAKVLLVPWLAWNWMIGWTVYVHHISPKISWHNRRTWRKFAGQVETTSSFRVPRWLNFFLHNIFVHIPHHVDPRIPFYHLPTAAEAIACEHPHVERPEVFRFRSYLEATRSCKLYDFERRTWLSYDAAESSQAQT